jgi:hypothetical protein
MVVAIVLLVVAVVIWRLQRALLPAGVSRQDQQLIAGFGDSVLGLLEKAKTPVPILVTLILWDVIRRKDSRIIRSTIQDSKQLQHDFLRIVSILKQHQHTVV